MQSVQPVTIINNITVVNTNTNETSSVPVAEQSDVATPSDNLAHHNQISANQNQSSSGGKGFWFRLVSNTTGSDWAWDVTYLMIRKSLAEYDVEPVDVTYLFDSGSVFYDDPSTYKGYKVQNAFKMLTNSGWGGRRCTETDLFFIGGYIPTELSTYTFTVVQEEAKDSSHITNEFWFEVCVDAPLEDTRTPQRYREYPNLKWRKPVQKKPYVVKKLDKYPAAFCRMYGKKWLQEVKLQSTDIYQTP